MKMKFPAFALAAVLFAAGISARAARQPAQGSATQQQKLDALNDAYRNGLLTPEQYAAKLRQLNGTSSAPAYSANPGAFEMAQTYDPEFRVVYMTTPIPAGWFFQGGKMPGNSCDETTYPFFRVNSPDGLSGLKMFPRLTLAWSNNRIYIPNGNDGCLPYDADITAVDYMKYALANLHVRFVRDLTDPADVEQFRNDWAQQSGRGHSHDFADKAVVLAGFNINSIAEEERIVVEVQCEQVAFIYPRGTIRNRCSVYMRTFWAPQGQLDAAVAVLRPTLANIKFNPQWVQLWSQAIHQEYQAKIQMNNAFWANMRAADTAFYNNLNRQIIANGEAFRQQLNSQYQTHEAQVATMQRGGDMAMARTMASTNSQSRMAADMCDYSLGVQNRVNPGTGESYKTDNNFQYDWLNSDGHTHVTTNYVNDNPNGTGRGNWTLLRNQPN